MSTRETTKAVTDIVVAGAFAGVSGALLLHALSLTLMSPISCRVS